MSVRGIERLLEQWEMGVKDVHRRVILAPTPRERALRQAQEMASICHCSRNRSISLTPIAIPSLTPGQANTVFHNSTPCFCVFHLGFSLES